MISLGWLLPWEPSILDMTVGGVAALLYLRGSRLQPPCWQRRLLFWLGLASLYFAAQSRLDYYSEHSFLVRQIQDSFLHHTGPFLIAISRPAGALLAALPISCGEWMKKRRAEQPQRRLIELANHPLIAVTLFCGVTAVWLLPKTQLAAMLDWRWHQAMNWSMIVNGLMFWTLVLNTYAIRPSPLPPGCRIAMMLAAVPPQIVMGALLFSVSYPLYPVYSLCGLIFSGMTPLTDQQLGGLILWVHGAMMSVLGILLVVHREWMAEKPARNNYCG